MAIRVPTTEYPSLEAPLPSDFDPDVDADPQFLDVEVLNSPSLGQLYRDDIGYFARHAQVGFLLDQLLSIMRLPFDRSTWLRLRELDGEVQNLSSLLMQDEKWAKRYGFGAIASNIRYVRG
jgi:hypothetical protein